MKMIAGAILCLAGAHLLAPLAVGNWIIQLLGLLGASFLLLTGFGYFVLGAVDKKEQA